MRISTRPAALAVLLILCSLSLPAGTVDVPNLSFLFDHAAGAIRPISGVPGAAIVGDPVVFARNAAIAPGRRFALVDAGSGEPLRIWRLDRTAPAEAQTLHGVLFPDRIIYSPGGSAAVLVSQSGTVVQVLTGLPDSPTIHSAMETPEQAGAFAVNDAGDLLAGGDSVWLLRENEAPRRLPIPGPVSAVALEGSDALIAGADQILLLRNLPDATEYRTLADYAPDRAPAVVQFSAGAAQALAAYADGEVLVLVLEGGEPARLACRCRPTALHRLAGGSLFQLNEAGNEPVWLLETAGQPRLWFVPRPLAAEALEEPAQ
jgi:hypothetical protein